MPSNAPPPCRHVVRIVVDELRVAVDAAVVREVLGALELTPLPGGPRGLAGVVSSGGRALAALDLASLAGGFAPVAATTSAEARVPRARTLVLETELATLALPIDRAYEPAQAQAERPGHAVRLEHARLEVDVGGETLPLFDVHEFMKSLEAHS